MEAIRSDGRLTDIKLRTLNGKKPAVGFAGAKDSFAIPEELENRPRYDKIFDRKDI